MSEATSRCVICGEPLPESASFCSHCGNPTNVQAIVQKRGEAKIATQLIRCPDCGKAVSDDAVWCLNCGKVIGRPALIRAAAEKRKLQQAKDLRLLDRAEKRDHYVKGRLKNYDNIAIAGGICLGLTCVVATVVLIKAGSCMMILVAPVLCALAIICIGGILTGIRAQKEKVLRREWREMQERLPESADDR